MRSASKYNIHHQHPDGRKVGDVMPFYYNGVYHVFYLLNGSGHEDINHEHAISTDLLHWTTMKPSILHEDNCAFTGCYIQAPDGVFHCFFTRWNPDNTTGREKLGHAVSSDLITWRKNDWSLLPDGRLYSDARYRDFRDPCIFYEESDQYYHMLLLANSKQKENDETSWDENWVQGHYRSKNLIDWEPLPAITGNFADECPDYIFHEGRHYIHGCHRYAISNQQWGPYLSQDDFILDQGLRAAKTCRTSDRFLWFGGFIGGSFTLPREIVFLPSGRLGLRMAIEMNEASNRLISKSNRRINDIQICRDFAYRIEIVFSNDDCVTIDFSCFRFELDEDVLTFINQSIVKTLDANVTFDASTNKIDIIIDADLVELYWAEKGAFTYCSAIDIENLSIFSNKEIQVSVYRFL